MRSRLNRKTVRPRTARVSAATTRVRMESLESRLMFHLEPAAPLGNTVGSPGGAATVVDLSNAFDNEEVNGTIVRLATTNGNVDLQMLDAQAPRTVANYLSYVNSGRFNGTIFHRSVVQPTPFVIQGGGFLPNGTEVQEDPPVRNEFDASRSNVRGTVAMAKIPGTDQFGNPIPGGGPDSATSQWFVNLSNNGGTAPNGLDFQNGGFTVFARVINNTMTTVDAIAALPTTDATEIHPAFSDLPTRNPVPDAGTPAAGDFVVVNTASVIPEGALYTYTATSSNPALVNPVVNGTSLSLQYGAGTGTATITVTATDVATGQTANQTFQAGVGELNLTLSAERGQPGSVTFTDADGTRGTVSVARAGLVTVRLTGSELTQTTRRRNILVGGTVAGVPSIAATDTTQETTITVRGRGGNNLLATTGLTTDAPLRTLAAKALDVTGNVTIGGTARTVQLGRLADGTLTIGGTPADAVPVSIDIGLAQNGDVTAGSDVRSFKAGEFSATGGRGVFTAPSLGALSARGPFAQDITVAGDAGALKFGGGYQGNIAVGSVRSVTVRGDMTGSNIDTTAAFDPNPRVRSVGSLRVSGTMNNVRLRSSGNVGSITGASAIDSTFFAAVQGSPNQLPSDATRFTSAATIGSVRFANFADSLISASALGRLNLATVPTNNAGEPFGVAANTITQLTGRTNGIERFTLRNLDTQADADQQIAAAGVNLADFDVLLF